MSEPMLPGAKKYVTAWNKKYPNVPPHTSGMLLSDEFMTICKAMEMSGTTTDVYKIRKACNEAITKIPYQAFGEYKGITPGGQAWGYSYTIAEIGSDGQIIKRGAIQFSNKLAAEDEPKM